MENQEGSKSVWELTCLVACTWGVPRWTDKGILQWHSDGGEEYRAIGRHIGRAVGAQTALPSAPSSAGKAEWLAPTTHHHRVRLAEC